MWGRRRDRRRREPCRPTLAQSVVYRAGLAQNRATPSYSGPGQRVGPGQTAITSSRRSAPPPGGTRAGHDGNKNLTTRPVVFEDGFRLRGIRLGRRPRQHVALLVPKFLCCTAVEDGTSQRQKHSRGKTAFISTLVSLAGCFLVRPKWATPTTPDPGV